MFDAAPSKTCSGVMLRVNRSFLSTRTFPHRENAQADCDVKSVAYAVPEHAGNLLRQVAQVKTLVLEHDPGSLGETGFAQAGRKPSLQSIFLASFNPRAVTFGRARGDLFRVGFGQSTNPRARPHEGDHRGAGFRFRQRSSLSLWDANIPHSPHASLAPSSAFVPAIPAAWRIAGPSCPLARSSIPRRLLMDTVVAWAPFAERAARCFSSLQRPRPRGDAPTVACGPAPQAAAWRRDPRRRLDLIPPNQRAADRRPRSQRALTLTAQRKVQCL
jgi:hypothetical protein